MDLFEKSGVRPGAVPLAARMRPQALDDIVGQDRILGQGKLLRRAIEADRLQSVILYGPPGCGKTSLAEVIALATRRNFLRSSGVTSNVAELRDLLKQGEMLLRQQGRETILFIDEIHRFNKSQQDVLLPYLEKGAVTLVGATTHNPLFFINSPLTSRSLIFELSGLDDEAIRTLLRRALVDARGLKDWPVTVEEEALGHLARLSEGDGRRALNALEIAVLTTPAGADGVIRIDRDIVQDSIQKKAVVYDHDEDGHYDTISAFIKSIRGSDPDAGIYWLAKMLYAGEDPRFIARRLVILASEDIGNADPRGLSLATAAMSASEFVGMPEARIILAQVVIYLASAPKSNAAYRAIDKALEDVRTGRTLAVPEHLKNVHVASVDKGGNGEAYRYPHDFANHQVAQAYMPSSVRYYEPCDQGYEATMAERLERWRRALQPAGGQA